MCESMWRSTGVQACDCSSLDVYSLAKMLKHDCRLATYMLLFYMDFLKGLQRKQEIIVL